MTQRVNTVFVVLLVILSIFLAWTFTWAADIFNLSYTLTEGGYQLELNPSNLYKGVNIRINTNIAKRYQVVQRIIQPLTNRENPSLIIQDNFVVRGIRGSNRFGDLRFSSADTIVRSEDIIYTSSSGGDADSFSLVYGLANAQDLAPGHYSGRISFTLNPIGASQQQVTKILEVYVSITDQGQDRPRVEIGTVTGSKSITLNPKKEKNQASGDVFVKINSSPKKQFNIVQVLPEALESEDGEQLDNDSVNFVVKDVSRDASINKATPLSTNPQNIYTSGADGSTDNYFVVTYILGDLSGEKTGKYKSRLQYLWDESGAQSKIDTIELVIDNERVFDLLVSPQDQAYQVEFRDLKPLGPAKTSEVVLEVKNNTGKAYQINQEISSELVNKEGQVIPSKYFTLRTENISAKGNLKFPQKAEIKKGNTILYVSDNLGAPAKLKVVYELSTSTEVKAGDYSANITYSLMEM